MRPNNLFKKRVCQIQRNDKKKRFYLKKQTQVYGRRELEGKEKKANEQ
jgi:hypothetical protein